MRSDPSGRFSSQTLSAESPTGMYVKSQKERKKTDTPREGWEDGTPPPHRDFKERGVVR